MTCEILSGTQIAADVRQRVTLAVNTLPHAPSLAVVLIGDDPASRVYVRNKVKFCAEVGIRSIEHKCPANVDQKEVIDIVRTLNANPDIDGILVQLPLPDHLDEARIIEEIDPAKDVDGLTESSAGRLVLGKSGLRPCTPTGCVILAKKALSNLSGKKCVVIGRSILVGKPAALLFLEQNCTVTIAHSRTQNIKVLCRSADIIVAAVGRPEMVKAEWVKPGACVIDVGINRVPDPKRPGKYKLVGDVDTQGVKSVAGFVTPVPGGVGPMTIACLLLNTVLAACARRGWETPDTLVALS